MPFSPYFGVFTDDPAVLGRMIPRPSAPFNSIDGEAFFTKNVDNDWDERKICESPPTVTGIDFGFDSKKGSEFTIF